MAAIHIRRLLVVSLLLVAGLAVAPTTAQAATTVCAQYCDKNGQNLVNDGLTTACRNNGQTVWTYNQGLAIGAAMELYRATGLVSCQDAARRLGTAALSSSLVSNGILTEFCDPGQSCDDNQKQFKGVFMRYLSEAGQFQTFADTQANSLWSTRDSLNRIGSRWAAPPSPPDWRTQAAALSALLVAS